MRALFASTVPQRHIVLAIAAAIAWFIVVPAMLTFSSFVMLTILLAGASWVLTTIFLNAQPTSSLSRLVHDADGAARERATKARRGDVVRRRAAVGLRE